MIHNATPLKPFLRDGFLQLPNLLLRNQATLQLSPNDFIVLLHLLTYWRSEEALPYISSHTIAERMGTTQRTVQRSMKRLQELGYLSRHSVRGNSGHDVTQNNLMGLKSRLHQLQMQGQSISDLF